MLKDDVLKAQKDVIYDRIFCTDCIQGMHKYLEKESIDLVVTSPPYNLQGKIIYDNYNDAKSYAQYIQWLMQVFANVKVFLKKGGRVVINIGSQDNGAIALNSDVLHLMIWKLGYKLITQIIWDKETVSNRTSWGSWLSPTCPSFPTPFEYVLVFAKDTIKLQTEGTTDLTKEEFTKWAYGIWKIHGIKNEIHPAPFPKELVRRAVKMFSWKGAVVLDPFMGSGTTAVVCKRLQRKFIGFDISPKYVDYARRRVANLE